jgi:PKD-like domain/Proprotein convertase P-domain/CHU_C Type IX secretion signal domain
MELRSQDCVCTNCPQFMPDNFVGNFLITVMGATNNTLGQNGQGVCGVNMHFDHEYIGDLSIVLTSPAGQSVTLVGPIGLFGMTDFSTWNISFVPCGDVANPDPGFNAQWSNNQAWGMFGNYTGSYFPNNGCLENFNTGPVNGTWTLTVTDGQNNDVGNFYDYEIIFCDPSGINCFSCAAEAGNLPQPDVVACEGASNLSLNLPPTYTPPQVEPPASDYGYTYVIGGTGGVILAYEASPDLTGYDPGVYTICGMSYLLAQQGLIPPPNGALTITQLSNQLSSTSPPLCGDMTSNCVNVTINANPPDEEVIETICAPMCYVFHNQTYCNSGTYVRNLNNAQGCPYTSTLYLTVVQPVTTNIIETICANQCSNTPGFETNCMQGNYQAVFTGSSNCDSIVNLNLLVLNVLATVAPPPMLTCSQSTVTLSGVGSSTGATVTYLWTASNGGNIVGGNMGITAVANQPGNYQLKVCKSGGGTTCCDSMQVTVTSQQNPPPAPASISGPATLCQGQTASFTAAAVVGATSYIWTLPPGVVINSGQNTATINVTWNSANGGNVCAASSNICGTSAPTCMAVAVTPIPMPAQPSGNVNVCAGSSENYSIPPIAGVSNYTWTVTGGNIILGQGSPSIAVIWGNSTGNVCVNATGTCGTSQNVCIPVNITAIPQSPLVAGPANACPGANQTYTLSPVPGATTYNWTASNGMILSGQGNDTIQVAWANNAPSGTVCANAANVCGSSPDSCLIVGLGIPVNGPVGIACDSANTFYTVSFAVSGGNPPYVIPGGTIAAGVFTSNPIASGQSYSFVITDSLGCISANVSGAHGCLCTSAAGNMSSSPLSACDGQQVTATHLGGESLDGNDIGAFVLHTNPGTPLGTIFNQNTTGTFGLSAGMAFGSTYYISFVVGDNMGGLPNLADPCLAITAGQPVVFHEIPTANAGLDTSTCASTLSLSATGIGTGTWALVTVPSGGNLTLSAITDPNSTATANGYGTYTLSWTLDNNGCTAADTVELTFNDCNCVSNAGTMDTPMQAACEGADILATHFGDETLDGDDIGAYFLHAGAGNSLGTVYASNTTGIFGFQTGMVYGTTYYVSYVVGNNVNGAPDLSDFCLAVSIGQPVVFYQNPVADAGMDLSTCSNNLTLNGNSLPNGVGAWSLISGNPANIAIAQPGNPQATATVTQAGNFVLAWTITQNTCVGTDQVTLQFHPSPTLANLVRTCDAANENFSVTLTLSGGTAPYTVNGNTLPGAMYFSPFFANGQNYTFTVVDANGCTMPDVTGSFSCNCSTNAGTMSGNLIARCQGQAITATGNNNQTLDANDVSAYVLHSGAGPALGQVFAQNTTGTFTFQPGMVYGTIYYISRVAGNPSGGFPNPADPCFSVATGRPVVWHENPVPNAGLDKSICGDTLSLAAITAGYSGVWTQVLGPGSAAFSVPTSTDSDVSVNLFGTYIFQWTETNNGCVGSDQVIFRFYDTPDMNALTQVCNNTNTQYAVSFTVTGGTAPYTVTGLPGGFTGNVYNSSPIASATPYSFQLTDANGCAVGPINGVENCVCATDAGTMQTAPLVFCANSPATGVWDNNGNTDGDDIIRFILHSTPGATLGVVYATNPQPTFNFVPPLQTGITYYISAIAGNNSGGNVDLNDPCLSIAPGVPVQWKPMPGATITGDATLCAGDAATITFSGTGTYPLLINYLDGGIASSVTLNNNQPLVLNPVHASTVVYNLLSVADGSLPTCTTLLNGTVTITVNQPVNAGIANDPLEFCAGTNLNIVLSNLITGADFGGQWTETSAKPSLPGAFNAALGEFNTSGQLPGEYTFRYRLTALAPCLSDEETVSIVIHPTPTADAGEDQAINCNQTVVTLGNNNTSPGIYGWVLGTLPVGNTRQIFVADAGTYTLLVTNTAGCTASDEVTVVLDNQTPVAEEISLNGIRCFGEANGSISIDMASAAHLPLVYALNDGPFQQSPVFNNLGPGDYFVTLLDPNGCESTTAQLTLTQPDQLLADLGADIEALLGDSVHLNLEATVQPADLKAITWQPLLDSSLTRKPWEQNFLPLQSWRVTVTVVDSNGCIAQDEVLVRVDKPRNVYIPNIFKPETGQEPFFYIYGGSDVAEVESFIIFDRWGNQVFEMKNFMPNEPAKGWDGRFNGALLNPGVFVYQASIRFIDGENILFKGDLTLVR